LLALVGVMNVEDQRAVREGLSEEELAIFDILTQPEPKLGPEDEDLVRRVAKSLLEKLHQLTRSSQNSARAYALWNS
jgi:type I restriction enzyme, R subunit